ncbi:MAG: hypothetical protein KA347_10875 [Bacteroidia bacterium]|nr:hypothetical protein [Bacteroidia bacterium]
MKTSEKQFTYSSTINGNGCIAQGTVYAPNRIEAKNMATNETKQSGSFKNSNDVIKITFTSIQPCTP